ncbi:hypothetical protein AOR13_672 [Alteromonas stellipolaris LMG 21856]|nr:hypothetical protein AOR13_672 [Alteromonas stellipolaris LMG 21856]
MQIKMIFICSFTFLDHKFKKTVQNQLSKPLFKGELLFS